MGTMRRLSVLALLSLAPLLAQAAAMQLQVDATDVERRIFRVRQVVPAGPGVLRLHYPEWIPGHHAPVNTIEAFAGLTIVGKGAAGQGRRINWRRDPLDVHAFHIDVPADVSALELEFQYASSLASTQGRVLMAPDILGVLWERMLLYPVGQPVDRIEVSASLILPAGWQFATALQSKGRRGDMVQFQTTTLETLVDSPVYAGRHFIRVDLDPNGRVPFHLNVMADTPEELEMKPEQLAAHRKLVQEAYALFGSHHFDHYDFLLAISDNFGTTGLEHHRSSQNAVKTGYFKDWDKHESGRFLLPHELAHSWDGKFRRPADLWTPDFNTPMRNTLMWVYEGMTEYWGQVLTVRSGLYSPQMARDYLAAQAANLQERRQGRVWRNLQDTTNQPIITPRQPLGWTSWQRSEDYYREGYLIWLEADTKIRELTGGARSLDDFARAFFGVNNGSYAPLTYTFDDVVKTLDGVARYDWATFLRARLESHGPNAPLAGIERAGWRIIYKDEPSTFSKKNEDLNETADFSYSIGLTVGKDAKITDVVWDGPAFKAGLSTAVTLVAVNGRAYKPELLKQAIRDAQFRRKPVELLIRNFDLYSTVKIDYAGGLRYPHLERIADKPDMLSEIFKPLIS